MRQGLAQRLVRPLVSPLVWPLSAAVLGAAAPAPVLSSINADGWSAVYPSPPGSFSPDSSPETVTASRQGFDTSGAATTYLEDLVITARVRQAYPNQASLTTDTVSLSDYVYSTDTISGVTNSSAETSPKPIVNWIAPDRFHVPTGQTSIGGSVQPVEILAAHRNARQGKEVAAVKFIISDGSSDITATVTAWAISGRTGDKNPVSCLRLPETTISALNDGLCWIDAEVYPWIGGSAAVNKSADNGSGRREFTRRYFWKGGSTYYAYVKSGGSSGGVFSTSAVTAEATPFDTIDNLWRAINSGAAGKADGVIVRLGNDGGTPWVMSYGLATARNQSCAAITITRDPNVARANARCSFGAASFRPHLSANLASPVTTGALRFADVSVVRTGTGSFLGETANLEIIWDDVDFDNGSFNAAWLSSSHDSVYGMTATNPGTTSGFPGAANIEHRCWRGLSVDLNSRGLEGWLVVGCNVTRAQTMGDGGRTQSGAIRAFSKFLNYVNSASILSHPGGVNDVDGLAELQNLFEYCSATSQSIARVSGDNATGDNRHICKHNNTYIGFFLNGRGNYNYDEGSTPRTSTLGSWVGNIHVQINTKGDVFVTDGTRVGNWAYLYGVGCRGEFSQFIDADSGGLGGSFAQAYPGLGADIGTSASVRNDPLFTDYQGTTSGPTGGAGNGTYTIGSSSPCRAMLAEPVLSHDLAGNTRAANDDDVGAYRYAA